MPHLPTELSTSIKPVVIVVGQSGAGLGTYVRCLEDLAFYTIDNLPAEMLRAGIACLQEATQRGYLGAAVALGHSSDESVNDAIACVNSLRPRVPLEVVFLSADDDTLFSRYSITRRRHPYATRLASLGEAVTKEAQVLAPLKKIASYSLDTSGFSPGALKKFVENRYASHIPTRTLLVSLVSFGFKHGSPSSADMVLDLRFARNPFFVENLKTKTGLDTEVSNYVFEDPRAIEYLQNLLNLLTKNLQYIHQDGKHYYRIAIGCTGGQHRSVAFVERLSHHIRELGLSWLAVETSHRDIHGRVEI